LITQLKHIQDVAKVENKKKKFLISKTGKLTSSAGVCLFQESLEQMNLLFTQAFFRVCRLPLSFPEKQILKMNSKLECLSLSNSKTTLY
jgi:hypothetical protein